MNGTLLWLVTGAYAFTAMGLFIDGRYGMSLCFTGYAIANVGLIMDIVR